MREDLITLVTSFDSGTAGPINFGTVCYLDDPSAFSYDVRQFLNSLRVEVTDDAQTWIGNCAQKKTIFGSSSCCGSGVESLLSPSR